MKKGDLDSKEAGFTIIEVSLVLAIAGLILLMVFIALPALQRSSRDTQRKEDISALVSAVKKYQSNNRGALPTGDWKAALTEYLSDDLEDPNGEAYTLVVEKCAGTSAEAACGDKYGISEMVFPNGYQLYIVTQAKCSGDETTGVTASSNPRKYAVLYKLEGGGLYCENG